MRATKVILPHQRYYARLYVAEMLDCDPATLRRMESRGKFTASVMIAGKVMYPRDKVDDWFEELEAERRNKPSPADPTIKRPRGRPRKDGSPALPRKKVA
jgi:hypothetical protein